MNFMSDLASAINDLDNRVGFLEFVLQEVNGPAKMQELREKWESRCRVAEYFGIELEEVDALQETIANIIGRAARK